MAHGFRFQLAILLDVSGIIMVNLKGSTLNLDIKNWVELNIKAYWDCWSFIKPKSFSTITKTNTSFTNPITPFIITVHTAESFLVLQVLVNKHMESRETGKNCCEIFILRKSQKISSEITAEICTWRLSIYEVS